MSALPTRTIMSDPNPSPNHAQARAWHLAIRDFCSGLFGSDGTPATARAALKLPSNTTINYFVNSDYQVSQRGAGAGAVGAAINTFLRDAWYVSTASSDYTFASDVLTVTAGSKSQKVWLPYDSTGTAWYTASWSGTGVVKKDGVTITSPHTFQSGGGNTPIVFQVSAGTLINPLLEPGQTQTQWARPDPDLELRRCQRQYVVMPLSGRFPASAASQYYAGSFRFPVDMVSTPTATYITGQTNSANLTSRAVTINGNKGGRFDLISSAAGDCFSLDGLWGFQAV